MTRRKGKGWDAIPFRSKQRFRQPRHGQQASLTNTEGFPHKRVKDLVSMDFLAMLTATFRVLFILVLVGHRHRHIGHVDVTERPTVSWAADQIVQAFPNDTSTRFWIRDRECIFGQYFRERVQALGIQEIITAPS
jgi:hypothetical protein